jgi:hypothetical protein
MDILNFIILLSISRSRCIQYSVRAIHVGHFCEVHWNKEVCRPFLGNLLQVFLCQLVVRMKLMFVLINACCDIGEVAIHVEFDQRSKPMKCVWCEARCRLD